MVAYYFKTAYYFKLIIIVSIAVLVSLRKRTDSVFRRILKIINSIRRNMRGVTKALSPASSIRHALDLTSGFPRTHRVSEAHFNKGNPPRTRASFCDLSHLSKMVVWTMVTRERATAARIAARTDQCAKGSLEREAGTRETRSRR